MHMHVYVFICTTTPSKSSRGCKTTKVVQTDGNMSKFVFLSVDCLMFDTSRNDAADVYKAQ